MESGRFVISWMGGESDWEEENDAMDEYEFTITWEDLTELKKQHIIATIAEQEGAEDNSIFTWKAEDYELLGEIVIFPENFEIV